MEQQDLEIALEHAAAHLLIAAERDRSHAEEMRDLAAQLQEMMSKLGPIESFSIMDGQANAPETETVT